MHIVNNIHSVSGFIDSLFGFRFKLDTLYTGVRGSLLVAATLLLQQ